MNNIIKELALQADPTSISPSGNHVWMTIEDFEKFANSIVRACLLQVADVRIEHEFNPVLEGVLIQALVGIRKHFEVEQ